MTNERQKHQSDWAHLEELPVEYALGKMERFIDQAIVDLPNEKLSHEFVLKHIRNDLANLRHVLAQLSFRFGVLESPKGNLSHLWLGKDDGTNRHAMDAKRQKSSNNRKIEKEKFTLYLNVMTAIAIVMGVLVCLTLAVALIIRGNRVEYNVKLKPNISTAEEYPKKETHPDQ